MRYAVIMAGGAGTRLWPMSTRNRPKQLLRFIGGDSLLSIAAARLRGLIAPSHLFVCTSAAYAQQVIDELSILPARQILGEPMGRDTANAVAFPAAILSRIDPEATMAVLTADHIIEPIEVFQKSLEAGFHTVEKSPETLVTFGIAPTHPATGYGYIHKGEELAGSDGVFGVAGFREKPSAQVAEEYLASGKYLWNSGMFVWKVSTILNELKTHLPQTYEGVQRIAAAWNTPEYEKVLNEIYPTLPKISIDYAIMEKTRHAAVIPMPVTWLDVGNWNSFAATVKPDADANRIAGCDLVALDSSGVLAVSDSEHLIGAIGVKNIIVIHTADATLICSADHTENIKQLVERIQKQYPDQYT
ncbi:MAG TPA: mannose-1-phosphate guanylyltransferase [Phycisphaerae bacterium]|nr:mannose-1-phosphate guanylyltransferase [Phycisphaerae bacterium]